MLRLWPLKEKEVLGGSSVLKKGVTVTYFQKKCGEGSSIGRSREAKRETSIGAQGPDGERVIMLTWLILTVVRGKGQPRGKGGKG